MTALVCFHDCEVEAVGDGAGGYVVEVCQGNERLLSIHVPPKEKIGNAQYWNSVEWGGLLLRKLFAEKSKREAAPARAGVRKWGTALLLAAIWLAAAGAGAGRSGWAGSREQFTVTAYCPCSKCTDGDGKTATGGDANLAGVAVDPAVVPLGARLDIPGYGEKRGWWTKADDTGGSITGKRLDVRFLTHGEAQAWGRKTIWVRVWRKRAK